jgi:hypothetical protein
MRKFNNWRKKYVIFRKKIKRSRKREKKKATRLKT